MRPTTHPAGDPASDHPPRLSVLGPRPTTHPPKVWRSYSPLRAKLPRNGNVPNGSGPNAFQERSKRLPSAPVTAIGPVKAGKSSWACG